MLEVFIVKKGVVAGEQKDSVLFNHEAVSVQLFLVKLRCEGVNKRSIKALVHQLDKLAGSPVLFRSEHDCYGESDLVGCALITSVNSKHGRLEVLLRHVYALSLAEGVFFVVED